MGFYSSLTGSGSEANPWCGEISLATTATSDLTFTTPISHIEVTSDVDTKILLKFGASAPAAEGTPGTPIRGMTKYIGPSHPPVMMGTNRGYTVVGIKNMGAVTAVFKFNAWVGNAN